MLTRLEVDGFKTFEGLKVDFMPFTAILGSNAAGKSNLFDVIQLLSYVISVLFHDGDVEEDQPPQGLVLLGRGEGEVVHAQGRS